MRSITADRHRRSAAINRQHNNFDSRGLRPIPQTKSTLSQMQQGFTIITRRAGGRCLHNRSSCCRLLDACTSLEPTFSPDACTSLDWYLDLHELNAVTLMPWRAYLNPPPRRRSGVIRSRPTPPMHSHSVEVSSALLLAPVVREQVRPISQARDLLHSQIPLRLSLLNPERFDVKVFDPARTISHNDPLGRRAVGK